MMATFYLLSVLVGAGWAQYAWGGPALVRFDDLAECEAAAATMRSRDYVLKAECVQVYVRR
jgi:hypothetical protein